METTLNLLHFASLKALTHLEPAMTPGDFLGPHLLNHSRASKIKERKEKAPLIASDTQTEASETFLSYLDIWIVCSRKTSHALQWIFQFHVTCLETKQDVIFFQM